MRFDLVRLVAQDVLRVRSFVRRLFYWLAGCLGSEIRDERTGKPLGRALLLPWRGRIYVVGAHCQPWVPVPMRQESMCFWKQAVGFATHEPGCPQRRSPAVEILAKSPMANLLPKVCLVLLDHREADQVRVTAQRWCAHGFTPEEILVVYGGSEEEFARIDWGWKSYIADPRLRTRDHQKEKQSYRGIFSAVTKALADKNFTHLLFAEYDHWPLAENVPEQNLRSMEQQGADVLGYEVRRLDGTLHPYWLGAESERFPFAPVWSMLGTGHFWKREAWEEVTAEVRSATWYLELDLPTTAYNLGFVLGRLYEQEPFVRDTPENLQCTPKQAKAAGAWTMHPVKGGDGRTEEGEGKPEGGRREGGRQKREA